jgi:ribosomal peptide maturation radical SAM protein 1
VTGAGAEVALVSMPFADADRPSLQLGLLAAAMAKAGLPVRTVHASLDFASSVGMSAYRILASHRGRQFGDWLFSVAAFGADAPDPDGQILEAFRSELPPLDLLDLRDRVVPAFLDSLADDPAWASDRFIGFTTTFQQNAASFALARRLKERYPGIVTIFGGANFDSPMGAEYHRCLPYVDHFIAGPGEVALPLLIGRLTGVAVPSISEISLIPDYDEYFARAERLGMLDRETVLLPFESSRGCWWGAKHHCTFCGLNGETMRYRSKAPERVLAELDTLARRYRTFRFEAVDNILDPGYLSTVMPALTTGGYDLFYEVKANLSRADLRLLARAGVRRLQPGLESLNSRVLRLMRKGVRAAQNVCLLKWARYYDIDIAWNLLWGFPGETADDYAAQAAAVPSLAHLQPPGSADRIWLERFSPLFAEAAQPEPEPSYRYVYPSSVDLSRAAYFFEWPSPLDESVYAGVRSAVARWTGCWSAGERPTLTYRAIPGLLQIQDRRPGFARGTYTFPDPVAAIYLACDERPRSVAGVAGELDLPASLIDRAVAELTARGLLFRDEDRAIGLALPAISGR